MLAGARDIWAAFFLEKRMGALREDYMQAVIDGRSPGPDYWTAGEQAIWQDLKSNFYDQRARQFIKAGAESQISDEEDYAGRTQKLMEAALLSTHHKLAQIPFVGQPEFSEQTWSSRI